MPTLLERNQGILDRIRHLDRIRPQVQHILIAGKLQQLAQGVDAKGSSFAPLKPSTLRQRRSGAPPLGGSRSRLARSYEVEVEQLGDNAIKITAGFRGCGFVKYLQSGTRKMVSRDPGGFREEDLDEVRRLALNEVMGNG